MNRSLSAIIPSKARAGWIFNLSLAVGLLMAVLSLMGLTLSGLFYPDPRLVESYLTNDLVNLLVGLPLFLLALIGFQRDRLSGVLLLPGALIYVVYNYLAYILGQPFSWIIMLDLGLVILALITLILLLSGMDHRSVQERLQGQVADRLSGWVLVIFGLAFLALAVSQILTGIQSGSIPPLGENAVAIADIVVSIGWIAGGVLILRRFPLGYSCGLGLLIAASALFLGLILFFFLAPILAGREFDVIEVLTVLVMGLVAFVPTGLYWRGGLQSEKN